MFPEFLRTVGRPSLRLVGRPSLSLIRTPVVVTRFRQTRLRTGVVLVLRTVLVLKPSEIHYSINSSK